MATEKPNPIKKYLPRVIGILMLGAGAFYGFRSYRYNQQFETTDNAQIEGKSAPVLARVAGYLQELNVEDYKNVQANELVAAIDPQEFQIAVQQAEADLQQSVADIETAKASVRNVQETYKVARANADVQVTRKEKANADVQRDKNLFDGGSLTRKVYDDTKSNLEVQARQLDVAQAQIVQAKVSESAAVATIRKMEAVLKVKQSVLDQARLRLSYTKINAPIAGKVGKVGASKGQYVQPGQTLFTIMGDTKFWVTANFKETQLEKITIGQPVDLKLDAFPSLVVKGKVIEISDATGAKFSLLPPDNASGNFVKVTQKIPVKIEILDLDKLKDKLRTGMSVEVSVRVNETP